jgi:hypothetical protein
MTGGPYSDEILMCFADGELDEATSAEIAAAVDADPALADRVAIFLKTRSLSTRAMAPMLDEPVPHELRRRVEAMVAETPQPRASVVELAGRRPARLARVPSWAALPAAASIAAVLGGLTGWMLSSKDERQASGLAVAGLDGPALVDALASVPSGKQAALEGTRHRFVGIASFRDATGALCREFEVDMADGPTMISVACREAGNWQVRLVIVAPGDQAGYAPASSTETLDAYLAAIGAEPPLSQEMERDALAAIASPANTAPKAGE